MNLTIPDLARLETMLADVIAKHERDKCERIHIKSVCTIDAVAMSTYACEPSAELVCATYVAYITDAIQANDHKCEDCGRRIADCWSVVMLP